MPLMRFALSGIDYELDPDGSSAELVRIADGQRHRVTVFTAGFHPQAVVAAAIADAHEVLVTPRRCELCDTVHAPLDFDTISCAIFGLGPGKTPHQRQGFHRAGERLTDE